MATLTRPAQKGPPPGRVRKSAAPVSVQLRPLPPPDAVALSRYIGFVRRQWLILAACLLAGGLLGALRTAVLEEPTYTATVAVLAPPVPLHAGANAIELGPNAAEQRRPRDSTMDTETQLVYSAEVLGRLNTFPGYRLAVPELKKRISMRVPPNTRMLMIMVRAGTPAAARDGADIVAEAYLTLREQILGAIQQRNRESLERRQNLLRRQLNALPGDKEELARVTVRTRRQAIMHEISEIQRDLSVLDGTAIQPGEVVRGAGLPSVPDDQGREVSRTGGAGLGLLAGMAIALRRERRPRRLHSPAEAHGVLGVPVLAELPAVPPGSGGTAPWTNACRRLRNLVREREASTVLLIGVPADDAVRLAHGLAAACTEGGTAATVLLVVPRPAGAAQGSGAEPYPVVRISDDEEERVVTAAIAKVRQDADVVIIAGPLLGGAAGISTAVACDLTLLVADLAHALDRELVEGTRALAKVRAAPDGLVLVRPGRKSRPSRAARTGRVNQSLEVGVLTLDSTEMK